MTNKAQSPARTDSDVTPPSGGASAAWAHKHLSVASTLDELSDIWRDLRKPFTGMGMYYASRTRLAQEEIHLVYLYHRKRLASA